MCLHGDRTHLYILRALLAWLDETSSSSRAVVGVHVGKVDRVDVGAGDQSICSGMGTCPWTSLDGNTFRE